MYVKDVKKSLDKFYPYNFYKYKYTVKQTNYTGLPGYVRQVEVISKVFFHAESESSRRTGPSRQGFKMFEVK